MLYFRLISALLLLCACAQAQFSTPAPDKPVKGTFYATADDTLSLYVNGTKVHACSLGLSQSQEVELKPGDRIVARLNNYAMPRYFMLLFVSSDRQVMISFPHTAFKILPDLASEDFDPKVYPSYRISKQDRTKKDKMSLMKNKSEWVWGNDDFCALGALLTKDSFGPIPK